jgi:hypothetical protein
MRINKGKNIESVDKIGRVVFGFICEVITYLL